jgi:putative chitinase
MDIDIVKALDTKYSTLLSKYGLSNPLRKAHFWGQVYHESKCRPISENLNYSAEGLGGTFHKYFPTKELANSYARKPERIANRVYGGRMGNGIEATGDGWKYKGRGFIQITGKDNYKALTTATGIDFLSSPDLLLEEPNALLSALWFWSKINGNKLADNDAVKTITLLINGGSIGLFDRMDNVKKLKEVF